jgi:c-di-GMP-binding flagellar brake protein YcgR
MAAAQEQLAQRLVGAESGIDETARKRRAWLGKHRDRFQLQLGAGKVHGHPAVLVDLSEGGIVARVAVNAAMDLPRGTQVSIRLGVAGRVQPLLMQAAIKQRDRRGEEVELRLGVAFSVFLESLPLAVRRAIGPREAVRYHPRPGQDIRLAIRGRSDHDAVSATVLDFSADGAGVLVHVSESRVAHWGRIVRVGLAHANWDDTVSSYAAIKRISARSNGVTLGLFFVQPEPDFDRSMAELIADSERLAMARAVG